MADEGGLAEALFAGIARAVELIDLRTHDGIHPRVGAADVVPIVPLEPGQMVRARGVALELGERVGVSSGCPCSSTARAPAASARRSSGVVARPSCSGDRLE